MKGTGRALGSCFAAVAVALACANPAGAATPSGLADQVRELSGGTAILGYDSQRARQRPAFARELERAGVKTVFFERLRLVAVRGNRTQVRRAAGVRGVRSAHMNERLKLLLHESVPLVYGGTHQSTWASGIDGRGGAVAVVDSGVDGLHPDLMGRMAANVKVLDPGEFFDGRQPVYLECQTACSTDTTGGHGTHVAGTVAGDGTASNRFYRGVAPGTKLVGLGVGEGPVVLYAVAAFEWILANQAKYGIVAVNNSWGPTSERVRYDATDPINVASRALDRAGVSVVFAAGNDGPDRSDCSTQPGSGGRRTATEGPCYINPYSVAPWAISVANGRKDPQFGPGQQYLNLSSSRGDPKPQQSLDGQTIDYVPTLTAPGTNIRSARQITGVNTTAPLSCVSAEPPACPPPAGAAQYEPFYHPLSGTSMAAPHVAGAVAVLQTQAQAKLGRRLTPAEVRQALIDSATPMTNKDGFFTWSCTNPPPFRQCGDTLNGRLTGKPYERWQVGAGYLNVAAALDRVGAAPASTATGGGSTAPGPTQTQSSLPPPRGGEPEPQPSTLPPASSQPSGGGSGNAGGRTAEQRAAARRAYRRCVKQARKKKTSRARARAKARCKARYG